MPGRLESKARAYLSGERNSDGGTGTEEISQTAGRYAQLIEAGDWSGLRAGRIQAESGGVGEIVDWRG